MSPKVYAQLQRTGMCNRLFTWAVAYLFSQKNNLPLSVNGWYKTQVGPWIRNERVKRFYALYFLDQSDPVSYWLRTRFSSDKVYYNPTVNQQIDLIKYPTIVFNSIPHHLHYFDELKGNNENIKAGLLNMIRPSILSRILALPKLQIGVHVRRGDFQHTSLMEQLHFYKEAIQWIRKNYGLNMTASIFSDGFDHELKLLTEMSGVTLFKSKTDIEDLLALSKSRFIVTSLGSTYSYWAAFLSNATIVHSGKFSGKPVRWTSAVEHSGFWIENPDVVIAESLTIE